MYQANISCVSFCHTDLGLMIFFFFSTQNKKNCVITLNFKQKTFVHCVEDNARFLKNHFLLASKNSGHFAMQTLVSTRNE